MKAKLFFSLFFLLLSQTNFGQSNAPLPFLKEVISEFPNVRDVAMSSDGQEVYFTVQSILGELSAIMNCKKMNGKWAQPQTAIFSGQYNDLEPFLAPGGLTLYFVSNRPLNKNEKAKEDFDIWYVKRSDRNSSWSEPVNMGAPVNSTENEFYPSVTNSGNLYFTSDGAKSKGKDDIFVCKFNNGKFDAPVSAGDSINSSGYEFNAFISPDESFLIYTCYNRPGGSGSGDLYLSRNNGNSNWTGPIQLGKDVNSVQMDYCPFYDTNSGILYFTSKRSEINAEAARPLNSEMLLKEINKYSNGQSRLYQVNIKSRLDKLK